MACQCKKGSSHRYWSQPRHNHSKKIRLINDGYLHEHVHVQQHTGQRLVDIEGLREKLQCICQWRPTSVFLRKPL